MQLIHPHLTIASGESESGILDLTGSVIVGIYMPATWTTADLSLLVCDTETGTFVPAYDADGNELVIQADASRLIALSPNATRGISFVKLRSGVAGAAVNQTAARALRVAVEPGGGS